MLYRYSEFHAYKTILEQIDEVFSPWLVLEFSSTLHNSMTADQHVKFLHARLMYVVAVCSPYRMREMTCGGLSASNTARI